MGCNPSSMLFFGFEIKPDDDYNMPPLFEHDDGPEEFFAEKSKITDDSGLFTEEGNYAIKEGQPGHKEAYAKWQAYLDRKLEAWKATGIEVDYHGSDEDRTPYLFLYQFSTTWDGLEEIPALPEIKPEQIQQLKTFCEFTETPYKEPKWYLAAYYG